jgi:uncharacterized protein
MHKDSRTPAAGTGNETGSLPAGDFSSWLRQARKALREELGTDVACGDCTGCCTSSYFIHIKPHETEALSRIPKRALASAPGQPKGHVLMGYDARGQCPMLTSGKCSIYESRPQTCRSYDCRIFAAAGLLAGGDEKSLINQRVRRWRFSYPSEQDQLEHAAVQAAANFMREHAEYFPGGRVPTDPIQLAILAIKAYDVFLTGSRAEHSGSTHSDPHIATAIVEACKTFDRRSAG